MEHRRSFPFKCCWHSIYREEREGKKGGNLYSWWADESGALHCRQFLFEFLFLPWTCCSAEQCPTKKDEHNKRTNYYIFTKNYSSLTLVIMESHTMWLPLTCCVRSHQCSKIILQSGLFMESELCTPPLYLPKNTFLNENIRYNMDPKNL